MRRTVLTLAIIMMACSARQHRGEATEAVYTYQDWEIRFTAAVRTLTSAKAAGNLDAELIQVLDVLIEQVRSTLDQVHADIDDQLDANVERITNGDSIVPVTVNIDLRREVLDLLDRLLILAARYADPAGGVVTPSTTLLKGGA